MVRRARASFARSGSRGAQCTNPHISVVSVFRKALLVDRCNFLSSLFLFLSFLPPSLFSLPSRFTCTVASAEGRPRSETQRVHRNRRGPRVTNASKMDKGYTWPPDGRRRHALLFPPPPSSLPLSLSLSLLRCALLYSALPTDKSRFYPSVHTCPSPTRMHVVTTVRSEGRKCTRITPGDAGGAEDAERGGAHCRNRSAEHLEPSSGRRG